MEIHDSPLTSRSMPAKPTSSKASSSTHAVFSFFSGAGFLDLGFEKSGFEIAFANELNAEFVEGYRHSRAKMGLPMPRYGIACDSIDDHLLPEGCRRSK